MNYEARRNSPLPAQPLVTSVSPRRALAGALKWTRLRDIAEVSLTVAVCERHRKSMNELPVGYTRVATEQQDLTSQREGLHELGCR